MSAEIPPEEQERLARDLAEQLRQLRVEDVLVNALLTVSSVGYRRLGATPDTRDDRDLEQTRLAIETMQALTPVLARFIPAELVRDFESSVANLQLAYAKVAAESPEATSGGQAPGHGPEGQAAAAAEEAPTEGSPAEGAAADVSGGQAPGHGPEGEAAAADEEAPSEESPAEGAPADVSGGQAPGHGPEGEAAAADGEARSEESPAEEAAADVSGGQAPGHGPSEDE